MQPKTINVLLGFDFGLKRIGVAVGQTVTQTASPLKTLAAVNGTPNWSLLKKILSSWQPDALVVGIPLNMDGSPQKLTTAAQNFVAELKLQFGLPVLEVDERLTTKAVRERIFTAGGFKALQTAEIDCMAAQLILQNWLNQYRPN
jgi:putative Holliday junction resolvase